MTARFELTIDQQQINSVRAAVAGIKSGYETVMKQAINRTLSTVQTQAVARIGNDLNLSAARIKKDFHITNATVSRVGGGVYATGRPVGLVSFGAKELMSGVQVKVKMASKPTILKHAFIGSTKTWSDGEAKNVFWRTWTGARKRWNINKKYARMPLMYRLPVQRLSGPRIEDIYAAPPVFDPITIQAQTLFVQRIDEEVTELLRRIAIA